jgi:hypothetical protein
VAAAQDGEQKQRADDGNDDRAKTAEAVRKESEHPLISSRGTPSVCIIERSMASRLNFSTARRGASFDPVCMMRWIFRLIMMTVAAKLINRYLGSRHPQPRPQS